MKTGQIIRKAVLQLLQEYEFRVAEAKKALNDFCACAPNDLDNFDVLNAKFEDAKKHQFDVADKLAFMLSRYADQLAFSDDPLAETLDDLIALAASEETLTDPVVAPEASHAADPVVAPEDSPAADPVVAPEDSPAADPVVINENDDIVFDITHSFRSIPMLAVTVINYAKIVKKCHLKGVYYGAYEAAQNNENKKIAPIINLTAFNEILEWTYAADAFMTYGNVGKFNQVYLDKMKSVPEEQRREWQR